MPAAVCCCRLITDCAGTSVSRGNRRWLPGDRVDLEACQGAWRRSRADRGVWRFRGRHSRRGRLPGRCRDRPGALGIPVPVMSDHGLLRVDRFAARLRRRLPGRPGDAGSRPEVPISGPTAIPCTRAFHRYAWRTSRICRRPAFTLPNSTRCAMKARRMPSDCGRRV